MIRVSVEVREAGDVFELAVYAGSINQAVGVARGRFPGRDVRVVFPIDGEEFFRRGAGGGGAKVGERARLLPDRVS